jgi:hypothetical protein
MGWEVVMAYLVPPMADEPPPEYIAFVAARVSMLRAEASRLLGGDRSAPELVMQVLTDLAGHWRRLCWRSRLTHRDAAGEFLDRRLTVRTRQWREEQIYPVEVNVLPGAGWTPPPEQILQPVGGGTSIWASPQDHYPMSPHDRTWASRQDHSQMSPHDRTARPLTAAAASARLQRPPAPAEESLARQLASFLPSTVRRDAEVVAEAEIAWVHAYRRYLWRRYCRAGGGFALLIGAMVQFMSQFSTTT